MLCSGPSKAQRISLWVEGEIGVPRTRNAAKRRTQVRAKKQRSRHERCRGIWIYIPYYACRAAATSMAVGDDEIILDDMEDERISDLYDELDFATSMGDTKEIVRLNNLLDGIERNDR